MKNASIGKKGRAGMKACAILVVVAMTAMMLAPGAIASPTLSYSTYLGGSGDDGDHVGILPGVSMAVDSAGNVYVGSATESTDFPTTLGAFDRSLDGASDAFLSKLSVDGSTLLWSTFLGGSGYDGIKGLAVDAAGNVYVTGIASSGFPTTLGAFDRSFNGGLDAFVAKFSSAGSLVYSTLLGGTKDDEGAGIALDTDGNAYVTGNTESSGFPTTPGAYDRKFGGGTFGDAFVVKLNPTGSALVYSTFLGGKGNDYGFDIAVDSSGSAYVTGETTSTDFPTTSGAFDRTAGGYWDGFMTKLNPSGSLLVYSTYVAGSWNDVPRAIALDSSGNAYSIGATSSADFPVTPGAYDTTFDNGGGGYDCFVLRLNTQGSALVYSTFLGSNDCFSYDTGDIAIDSSNNAIVTGHVMTSSGVLDFPVTPDAFDPTFNGFHDAFISMLDPTGSTLLYSTFLGGSHVEFGTALALDTSGNTYLAGYTQSADFPTMPGSYDTTFNGGRDVFVAKFGPQ